MSSPGPLKFALLPLLTLTFCLLRRWAPALSPQPDPAPSPSPPPRSDTLLSSPPLVPRTPMPMRPCVWELRLDTAPTDATPAAAAAGSASFCRPVANLSLLAEPAAALKPPVALANLITERGSAGPPSSSPRWPMRSTMTQTIVSVRRTSLTPGSTLACLVDKMEEWRTDFLQKRRVLGHSTFWQRTSKKIVLSVLVLYLEGQLVFVRGCNLEVSLPSGSLCSERNAFGTALTLYPHLRREDCVGIAVLSLTEGDANLNPLPPCGVCSAWVDKLHEVNKEFRLITFSDVTLDELHLTTMAPLATALAEIRKFTAVGGNVKARELRLSEAVHLSLDP